MFAIRASQVSRGSVPGSPPRQRHSQQPAVSKNSRCGRRPQEETSLNSIRVYLTRARARSRLRTHSMNAAESRRQVRAVPNEPSKAGNQNQFSGSDEAPPPARWKDSFQRTGLRRRENDQTAAFLCRAPATCYETSRVLDPLPPGRLVESHDRQGDQQRARRS